MKEGEVLQVLVLRVKTQLRNLKHEDPQHVQEYLIS